MDNATVGAGMIEYGLRRADNLVWHNMQIQREQRAALKAQKPLALWFTGLSGAGKSTIADRLEQKLHAQGYHTMVLDGDNVRHGLNRDLGFSDADRVENIRRVAEVANLMIESGLIVLVSFISPFRSERKLAQDLMGKKSFLEIFIDTDLSVCEKRDVKGLYQRARAGEIPNFTGISSQYEAPQSPDIHIKTQTTSADEAGQIIFDRLQSMGYLL